MMHLNDGGETWGASQSARRPDAKAKLVGARV